MSFFFIYFDWLSLILIFRNLFGQEYCHSRKRVARKEVKEAYEALTDEKKAVCLMLPFQDTVTYQDLLGICEASSREA